MKKIITLLTLFIILTPLEGNSFKSKDLLKGVGSVNFSYDKEIHVKGGDGETLNKTDINLSDSLKIGIKDDINIQIETGSGEVSKEGLEGNIEEGVAFNGDLKEGLDSLIIFDLNGIKINLGKINLIEYKSQFNNIDDDEFKDLMFLIKEKIKSKESELELFFNDNIELFNKDQQSSIYYNNIIRTNIPTILNYISSEQDNANNINYFFYNFANYNDKNYKGNIIGNVNNIFSYSTMNLGSLGDNLIDLNEDKNKQKIINNNSIVKNPNSYYPINPYQEQVIIPTEGLSSGDVEKDKEKLLEEKINAFCQSKYKFPGNGTQGNVDLPMFFSGKVKDTVDFSKHSGNISIADCVVEGYNPCHTSYTLTSHIKGGNSWTYLGGYGKGTEIILEQRGYSPVLNSRTSCTKNIDSGDFSGERHTWNSPSIPLRLE